MVASVARLVLAAVLIVAAVAKLRHRTETREQFVALLGARAGGPIATALPYVELGLAVALIVWWSAVPGIVVAILVVAFTVVLVRAAVRQLPCACFGAARSAPPGGGAVLRNAVLLALAILATGSPR